MKKMVSILLALTIGCFLLNGAYAKVKHFHPKGKPPSEHTKKVLQQAQAGLPFSDKRDFEESDRGFIAAPDSKIIMSDAGQVA